jgi:hypothetical protein
MDSPIWYDGDVLSAVLACRQRQAVLVVLIEPPASVMARPAGSAAAVEPAQTTYARGATAALHRVTFSSPLVREAVSDAGATCLRLQDGGPSRDFADFCAVFDVPPTRPALFMIGPNGRVLALELGFVSPKKTVQRLGFSQQAVQNPALADNAASAAAVLLVAAGAPSALAEGGDTNPQPTGAATQCSLKNRASCSVAACSPCNTPSSMNGDQGQGNVSETAIRPATMSSRRDECQDIADTSERAAGTIEPPVEAAFEENPEPGLNDNAHRGRVNASSSQEARHTSSGLKPMQLRHASKESARASISVRLPDGVALRKSFAASERFGALRSWVTDEGGLAPSTFALSTSFPKHYFDLGEDAKQLSELGLSPSATLFATVNHEAVDGERLRGLPTASSLVSSTINAVSSVAVRVASWLPTLSGDAAARTDATAHGDHDVIYDGEARHRLNATSMAEVRRRETRSRGGNQYYNGNGTQFNGEDDDVSVDSGR